MLAKDIAKRIENEATYPGQVRVAVIRETRSTDYARVIVLGIGDVIGRPGRDALRAVLPALRRSARVDVVVVNAENSAGGLGTTPETADDLFDLGADVLTGGNHTWKHREYGPYLESHARALRPLNYPEAPGRGVGVFTSRDGRPFAVVNLIGRTFMEPAENPFRAVERALGEIGEQGARSSSSTCTPKPRARSARWAGTSTGASASSGARTRTCPRPTKRSCPPARRTSATSA